MRTHEHAGAAIKLARRPSQTGVGAGVTTASQFRHDPAPEPRAFASAILAPHLRRTALSPHRSHEVPMPRLPVPSSAVALCMLAAAFACVAADAPTAVQQTADAAVVDLARGCWIRHAPARPDGRDTVLLRLLPDPERRDWLRGEIAGRRRSRPPPATVAGARRPPRLLSAASVRDPDAPAAGRRRAGPGADAHAARRDPSRAGSRPDGLARLLLGGDDRVAFGRSPRRLTAVGGTAGRSAEIDYRAEAGPPLRLRVNAAEERLSVTVGGADIGTGAPLAVFAGVRDGCD
ncbi:hypothetical protein FE772_10595 [Lysobacter enzymogenes]|nr:hypothetical protein [Lysobacter enzymogenes]QCW26049.1 hypothetical protein FE772_10595 [Lysobacter enzymogenes]